MTETDTIAEIGLPPIDFLQCPKYIKHDITEEQMMEIAALSVEIATYKAKLELADNLMGLGQHVVGKFFLGIGAAIVIVVTWLHANDFFKF